MVLLTECSMSDNVSVHYPDIEFVRPCNLCPHMKRITLPKIRRALETMQQEVTIDPDFGRPCAPLRRTHAGGPVVAPLPMVMVEPAVRAALLEDLGRAGDLTTDAIVSAEASARTALVARQPGVVAGLDFAASAFRLIDPAIRMTVALPDGSRLRPGDTDRYYSRTRPRHPHGGTDRLELPLPSQRRRLGDTRDRGRDRRNPSARYAARAKPCRGCGSRRNTRSASAVARTIGSGWMTPC